MATSKTLTPTNVTIQIPDFTDQPDQRVNSNCIDKEADAINALNSKISDYITVRRSIVTTTTINAGADYIIANQAITDGVVGPSVPSSYSVAAITPEGVRPNTSWNADPRLFYNDTSSVQKFQIHNKGSSADTMTATFVIIYRKITT